jgi:uncharacterized protein YjbI with pentapeptide repeats
MKRPEWTAAALQSRTAKAILRAWNALRAGASKVLSPDRVYWGAGGFALLALIILGYRFPWTGFAEAVTPKSERAETSPAKTLWDWMGLLIVPVLLAIGGYWFTHRRESLAREIEDRRREEEREREERRHREGRRRERDRLREEALQGYFDRMTGLMLDKELRPRTPDAKPPGPDDVVRDIARARTLTVLRRLDGTRKGILLRFLRESDLIIKDRTVIDLSGAILSGADLRGANLRETNLSGADLSEADLREADLRKANLRRARLNRARLSMAKLAEAILKEADLREADLREASLGGADLGGADLTGARLNRARLGIAQLPWAVLRGADLSGAFLHEAQLSGADLSGADLTGVIALTQAQLDSARGNENTKLPDVLTWPGHWGGSAAT